MTALTETSSIFQSLINILPNLDNKFSFMAFLFLVSIFALALLDIDKWVKSVLLTALIVLTCFSFYKYLESGLELVREESLVRLVKGKDRIKLGSGIEIGLKDVESLEGKYKSTSRDRGGIEYNCTELPRYVVDNVFTIAKVKTSDDICKFIQAEWEDYLNELGHSGEVIKDTPFARFDVVQNGTLLPQSARWMFRNQEISVDGDDKTRLKIAHIYNTKESTTGEPEAVELRFIQ